MATSGYVAVADGLGVPRTAPAAFCATKKLIVGWMPVPPPWLSAVNGGLAVMGGSGVREAIQEGRLSYLPARYSSIARLFQLHKPTTAIVAGRPSRGRHRFKFGLEVGIGLLAAESADHVIVEVDTTLPDVANATAISVDGVEAVEALVPAPTWETSEPDPVDVHIGSLMASLVPKEATVQYGVGAIGEAAMRSISTRVRIHSGMITEAVADLAERALVTGLVTTGYLLGGNRLRSFAESGGVRLVGVDETHGLQRLTRVKRFVALNGALTVGLDGAVNVERLGGRQIGGIGGHADFCDAAALSPGGRSIVGLRSTWRGKSTIVASAHPVSTSRASVDFVVTEYGIADLRGLDDRRRAQALIDVANPEYRETLLHDARFVV